VAIKFIYAKGVKRTVESVWELIEKHPQGLTMRELVKELKRPTSMLLICIKDLMKRKQVKAQLINERLVYFSTNSYVTQSKRIN
jgi:predicted transcriptional regulator